MKRKRLTDTQISTKLKKHPNWSVNAPMTKLNRTIEFATHTQAAVFIVRATVHAEVLQHHPDITFTYKKVKVVTTTHDVSGLTTLDFELVARLDALLASG